MIVGAVGLILSVAAGDHTTAAVVSLSLAAAGVFSAGTRILGAADGVPRRRRPRRWASRPSIHSAISQALSARMLVGWLRDLTHSTEAGMYAVAVALVVGAVAVLGIPARLVNR